MVENRKQTIKERIESKYESINKFIDDNHAELKRLGISRTYLYKLLNNEECNPTMYIMYKLSLLTNIPLEDIVNEYSMRYRDQQSSSQHTD